MDSNDNAFQIAIPNLQKYLSDGMIKLSPPTSKNVTNGDRFLSSEWVVESPKFFSPRVPHEVEDNLDVEDYISQHQLNLKNKKFKQDMKRLAPF